MAPGNGIVESFAHVGVAVTDIQRMLDIFQAFGYELVQRKDIVGQGTSHIVRSGTSAFDLLSPTTDQSDLARFIDRRGPGLHHVCLTVESLNRAVHVADRLDLRGANPKVIEDDDGKLAFLHPRATQGMLIGLFEPRR